MAANNCLFQYILNLFCAVIFVINSEVNGLPPLIKIGLILSKDYKYLSEIEMAFKYAVHSINEEKAILPDTNLIYDIQFVAQHNSYVTCKRVCSQLENGAQAIFGPTDSKLGIYVHDICDTLDIPHFKYSAEDKYPSREFSINVHPTQQHVTQAFLDLVAFFNWTKVGILYEKNYGILDLKEVMRVPNLEVNVRQVYPSSYQHALAHFKANEEHNLIIDTNTVTIGRVLKAIIQLQMNEYKYHFLFTSFDIDAFDLEDLKHNFVNISAYRLVDTADISVKDIIKHMILFSSTTTSSSSPLSARTTTTTAMQYVIQTTSALVYDAVYIFAIGLQTLEQSLSLHAANVSCQREHPWDGGLSLLNYINAVEWKGMTGPIQFKDGRRTHFKLDLIKLKQHDIVKVGEWSPHRRLNITDASLFYDTGYMNMTLVVITILETPYVMMHYGKNFTGNERFYGFCVDILEMISHQVGFDYILDLVPDRKYGARDPITGQWNGMVAQLMKYKADLAVGSMTITYARESVIDFTKPFMNLGISILFKVPASTESQLFSFMNPLAIEIWIYVLAAYILVSLTIYAVARCSPCEHHVGTARNRVVESKWSLVNSFWFSISTVMQQSPKGPQAMSTRIVSAIWWFFSLIMIASYTANLAAFLTVERMTTPIENAEDLASQTEISYGTLESGSTMTFFRDSLIETYRKMWRMMENKRSIAFTSTYEDGIGRVNEGNYAFLMESTMLDYIVQRDCNLTQIGGLLDAKGYGIATPKGSPWRDKISLAILELQERGDIQLLYDKWWKNSDETCTRHNIRKQTKANALGWENIGGIFIVLFVGIGCAICTAIVEFLYKHRQQRRQRREAALESEEMLFSHIHHSTTTPNDSLWYDIVSEFKYALNCFNSRRRPNLHRYCLECSRNVIAMEKLHKTTKDRL